MLSRGDRVTLAVERPAVGGAMIARHQGQVVLVTGAIPGERVSARIIRVSKGVAHADVAAVELASGDRRPTSADPQCGGCSYAHIAYARQLTIKQEALVDALHRIGHLTWSAAVPIAPSGTTGYRMRARLRVHRGRAGFLREGSHEICGMREPGQLSDATSDALDAIMSQFTRDDWDDRGGDLEVSENAIGAERVVMMSGLGARAGRRIEREVGSLLQPGITGVRCALQAGPREVTAGKPTIDESLTLDGHRCSWRRDARAFFQGNRFLLHALVSSVVGRIHAGSRLVDLYAGVGLFSVAAATVRHASVVAVEGDAIAAQDLRANAQMPAGAVVAKHRAVESFIGDPAIDHADTVIVDPPRTGLSAPVSQALAASAQRVVYVSCDIATFARDARQLAAGGLSLTELEAFDMFPNTPHLEVVGLFERR